MARHDGLAERGVSAAGGAVPCSPASGVGKPRPANSELATSALAPRCRVGLRGAASAGAGRRCLPASALIRRLLPPATPAQRRRRWPAIDAGPALAVRMRRLQRRTPGGYLYPPRRRAMAKASQQRAWRWRRSLAYGRVQRPKRFADAYRPPARAAGLRPRTAGVARRRRAFAALGGPSIRGRLRRNPSCIVPRAAAVRAGLRAAVRPGSGARSPHEAPSRAAAWGPIRSPTRRRCRRTETLHRRRSSGGSRGRRAASPTPHASDVAASIRRAPPPLPVGDRAGAAASIDRVPVRQPTRARLCLHELPRPTAIAAAATIARWRC